MIDATTAHKVNLPKSVFKYRRSFASGNKSYGDPLLPEQFNTQNLLPYQGHLPVGVDANISTQPGVFTIAEESFRENTRQWTQPEDVVPEKVSSVSVWKTFDPWDPDWSGQSSIGTRQLGSVPVAHPLGISSRLDEHQTSPLRQESPDIDLELDPSQIANKIVSKSTEGYLGSTSTMSGEEGIQRVSSSLIYGYAYIPGVYFRPAHAYPSEFEEKEIIELLTARGRTDVADRIIELNEIIRDESDDDQQEMQLDSLRSLADFFTIFDFPYLPHGSITVGYDGILGLGWTIPLRQQPTAEWRNWDGILSLEFLPSGKILFAGETRPTEGGVEFYDLGTGLHEEVFDRISPFFDLLRVIDAE